jgi:class 3 adenylate cyclase
MGLALANARLVARLRREREELRAALLTNQKLSQYLPQAVVARIEAAPEEALRLGGARRRAAVLFSDVVGFTPWAEVVSPEQVVRFLNALFAAMDPEIDRCGGILDKRIGDGMMVVFLEQDGGEPPARRALRCGLALQAAVVALNADPALPRSEPFALRVGVAYGEPVAGNIGSMRRLEYTVIGDVVNVASRLEGACAPGEVTATAQAVAAAGPGVAAESRGHLVVKGRQQPVEAFSIRSVGPWTSEP